METFNRGHRTVPRKPWLTTDRARTITYVMLPIMLFTPWVGDDQGTINGAFADEPLAGVMLIMLTALVVLPAVLSRFEVNGRAVTALAGVGLGAMLVLGLPVLSTMSYGTAYACAQAPCPDDAIQQVAIPWAYLAGLTAAVVNVLAHTDPPATPATGPAPEMR